jgi:hypothetical protein
MQLLDAKGTLTLTNPGIDLGGKRSVDLKNAIAQGALGAGWATVESAAELLGITLAPTGYTLSIYEKDGERRVAGPCVALADGKAAIYWGDRVIPLSDLKGVNMAIMPNGRAFALDFWSSVETDEDEVFSMALPLRTDREKVKGETAASDLSKALSTKRLHNYLVTPGASFVKMAEVSGRTLSVVGIEPPDTYGKQSLKVILDGSVVTLNGNAATQRSIKLYTEAYGTDAFTPECPGSISVGEGREWDGKQTFPVTLTCGRSSGLKTFDPFAA